MAACDRHLINFMVTADLGSLVQRHLDVVAVVLVIDFGADEGPPASYGASGSSTTNLVGSPSSTSMLPLWR